MYNVIYNICINNIIFFISEIHYEKHKDRRYAIKYIIYNLIFKVFCII